MEKLLEKEILKILKSGILTKEKLRKKLKIKGRLQNELFTEVLEKMEVEGQIFIDDKNNCRIFDTSLKYIQGKLFISVDGTGYFVGQKNGKKTKFEISHDHLNGALSGDIVVIKDRNKVHYDRKQATVLKVVKRHEGSEIFEYIGNGLFKLYNGKSEVYLYKREKECDDVLPGYLVLANIDRKPIVENIYAGETQKIVGHIDDPKTIVRAIGLKNGFDYEFKEKVMEEARTLPTKVTVEDIKTRKDLRKETIFTIDGDDTKDIDDAVSIEKDGEGYILKVHIADVSHYLKDKKQLTKEALKRGNSAYLADSVFPMLPHLLSNGICSLNPGEDRLTKTVEMKIDKDGNIISSEIYKSVIHSKKKMTYDNVNKILNGKKIEDYEPFEQELLLMNKLSKLLEKNRREDGALDFLNEELKIKTNIYGEVLGIKPRTHGDAEKIIESFMIAANTEVTKHYGYLETPFIYRVHPEPNHKKLLEALKKIKAQGIKDNTLNELINKVSRNQNSKYQVISPKELEIFLSKIKTLDNYDIISDMLLRCMERAYYSEENIGHFGLANTSYSHFTSPIRRAADLVNHFIIDLIMEYYTIPNKERSREIEKELIKLKKELPDIATHISETEILADKAEKEAENALLIEYFNNNIEDYEGPIESRIKYINKLGVFAHIDIFNVFVSKANLQRQGYIYRRQSRTYEKKGEEKLCIGDTAYLFYPEINKEEGTITYNEISKDEQNLLAPPKPKRLIKTRKINPSENPQ